jgi:hypothetical protein
MINGAHVILYSTQADADRAFFKDHLRLPSVDVGGGWLIFGLPPAEVAVHPAEGESSHALYLMCDDVEDFVAEMTERGLRCAPVTNQGWGLLTEVSLPSGAKVGVYQPRHKRPKQAATARAKTIKKSAKPATKKRTKAKTKARATRTKPRKTRRR